MAIKIIKADEPLNITTLNILVYGEPGAGKTSLAFTAGKPLCLDFDKGIKRSHFKKDALQIRSWEADFIKDWKEVAAAIKEYDTIIMDTVDTAIESMEAYLLSRDDKLKRNKLRLYGAIKDEFRRFINILQDMGKDIIMIAHAKEKDEGDSKIKRPQITGSSYDKVVQLADFVGYLYIGDNNQRQLNFNPSHYTVGKNSAKFDVLNIPNFNIEPDYFSSLMEKMKNALSQMSEEQLKQQKILDDIRLQLQNVNNVDDMNLVMQEILSQIKELKNGMYKQAQGMVYTRAKELKLILNKETMQYKNAVQEEPKQPVPVKAPPVQDARPKEEIKQAPQQSTSQQTPPQDYSAEAEMAAIANDAQPTNTNADEDMRALFGNL